MKIYFIIIIKVHRIIFYKPNITLAITAHYMTSRKLSWQVEHWHFSILVMKTIFLTWHSMAMTRMAVTSGSDQDGSNSGGSDEEFDDRKNDFSADGCSDCSSY